MMPVAVSMQMAANPRPKMIRLWTLRKIYPCMGAPIVRPINTATMLVIPFSNPPGQSGNGLSLD
jgi:hypothetical protein